MPGVPINGGNDVRAPRYLDLREGKIVNGKSVPYDSIDDATDDTKDYYVPLARRSVGQIRKIWNDDKTGIDDWQFVAGIEDGFLVKKSTGGDVTKAYVDAAAKLNDDNTISFGLPTGSITGSNTDIKTGTLQIDDADAQPGRTAICFYNGATEPVFTGGTIVGKVGVFAPNKNNLIGLINISPGNYIVSFGGEITAPVVVSFTSPSISVSDIISFTSPTITVT